MSGKFREGGEADAIMLAGETAAGQYPVRAVQMLDAIITELENTRVSERSGRARDKESEDAFERLRVGGYM